MTHDECLNCGHNKALHKNPTPMSPEPCSVYMCDCARMKNEETN